MHPSDPSVLAHGIAGRQDLPIPFAYAVVGAGVAVVVSFVALGLLWRTPRLRGSDAGRELPAGFAEVLDAPATRAAVRVLGLVLTGYALIAAFVGPDLATNPTAYVVFVLLWLGLVPLSVLVGPAWRLLNPLRTVHLGIARALRMPADEGLMTLSARVGYWPAAIGLFCFVWLELLAPDRTSLPVLRFWFLAYALIHLMCASLFGAHWFDHGDAFEVWSGLWGRFCPLGRRVDGALVVRNPLNGVSAIVARAGLVGVVCVALGSTAYDGLSASTRYTGWVQGTGHAQLIGTLGLLGVIVLVGAVFSAAAVLTGVIAPVDVELRTLPGAFAHTLVPIALGYLVAHYFSFFVLNGQRGMILLSDPLVDGGNWLGLSGRTVDGRLVQAHIVATLQVVAVVTGHVVGVVLAHDKAVAIMKRPSSRDAVLGQLPMLYAMVAYTVGGLLLLFSA